MDGWMGGDVKSEGFSVMDIEKGKGRAVFWRKGVALGILKLFITWL